jgi:uncharacterized membrane protein
MTDDRGPNRPRRGYLDWTRGIAVLLMIEAHLLDSWTATAERTHVAFKLAMMVAGMGTALFLLLAGVSVGLSAGSKWRRSGNAAAASTAVARRGLEIFALAFLFRLQAWVLGWSSNPYSLLKVDILNIMGPSIVFAALLWRLADTMRARALTFAAAAAITTFVTPWSRQWPLGFLPDPIEAYFVPVPGFTSFLFFPWMGFVFAGATVGVIIDSLRSAEGEERFNVWMGIAGMALAFGAYAWSFLPAERDHFWTTAPSYFFLRVGLMMALIAAAYAWNLAFVRPGAWSPILQLGKTSLFIYWIHVEMVYGLISLPLHRQLTLGQAAAAYVLFTGLMLIFSILKDRWVASRAQARRSMTTVAG